MQQMNVKVLSIDGNVIREVSGIGEWNVLMNHRGGQSLFSFEFDNHQGFETTGFVIIEEKIPDGMVVAGINLAPDGRTVHVYANDRIYRKIHGIQSYALWPGGGIMIHTTDEKQITTNMPIIIAPETFDETEILRMKYKDLYDAVSRELGHPEDCECDICLSMATFEPGQRPRSTTTAEASGIPASPAAARQGRVRRHLFCTGADCEWP